jgi:hypothetical protein
MSPRRIRFEAMVFRSESVRFEACSDFHPASDTPVCSCGWFQEDHPEPVQRRELVAIRRRRGRATRVPELRAS